MYILNGHMYIGIPITLMSRFTCLVGLRRRRSLRTANLFLPSSLLLPIPACTIESERIQIEEGKSIVGLGRRRSLRAANLLFLSILPCTVKSERIQQTRLLQRCIFIQT